MELSIHASCVGVFMTASMTSELELLEVSALWSRKVVDSCIKNDRISNMNHGDEMVCFEAFLNSCYRRTCWRCCSRISWATGSNDGIS